MKIAYTVCTANYLAYAKTLADSLIEHNPDYIFYIGLVDRVDGRFDVSFFAPHQLVEVENWNIPYFSEMSEKYSLFELSNAMKPYFADYLLQNVENIDILVYMDSDMLVFSGFSFVEECLKENSICLTPHILTPIPEDNLTPREPSFLNAGVYNGGFVAIRPDRNSIAFINWWKNVLRDYCWVKVQEGLFVDQLWLNLVPIFFDKVYILKHGGYNVAFYNLHERHMTVKNGKHQVNGREDLIVFHYTGYDVKQPQVLSRHQSRFDFDYRKDVLPLFQIYAEIVARNNLEFFETLAYAYDYMKQEKRAEQLKEEIRHKEAQEQFWQEIVGLVRKEVARESSRIQSRTLSARVKKKIKQYVS